MNKNLVATVLLVLAVGIYFTVTEGMLNEAKAVAAVNSQYEQSIVNAKKLIEVRDKVYADWKNVSGDDQARVAKMLPSSVDNIRLIIDLNAIALKHGFSLSGISATANASPKSAAQTGMGGAKSSGIPVLDTVTVSFGVTAPFDQFMSLLQDLEADLRLMDITHLSVGVAGKDTYNFTITMQTYWLRQQ